MPNNDAGTLNEEATYDILLFMLFLIDSKKVFCSFLLSKGLIAILGTFYK